MHSTSDIKTSATKLQLGPFQGITDVYFRNIFITHFGGIDKLFTPFFTGIHKDNSKSLRVPEIDPALNDVSIVVPQVLSNDAAEIIRFSEQCAALGYKEINLNMGCPVPMVAKKKRGSGMLPYTNMVAEILQQMEGNLATALSIKCRLGYNYKHEIDELITVFNQISLSELIIHARLGKQMYKGIPDTEHFAEIMPLINAPLVYNGDIFSSKHLADYQHQFKTIDTWMLGRGLLADPFLALDIKGQALDYTEADRKEKVFSFMTDIYLYRRKLSGDNLSILGRMKELWTYMRWSFDDPQAVWRLVRKVNCFEGYELAVSEIFKQHNWIGTGYAHIDRT